MPPSLPLCLEQNLVEARRRYLTSGEWGGVGGESFLAKLIFEDF
jgi:hypothetical protein